MRSLWLIALLGVGGCTDCPAMHPPPASCVLVAQSSSGRNLMTVTPACGIFGQDVDVQSDFTDVHVVMHVDEHGRSPAIEVPAGMIDVVELTWGDGCRTRLCVLVRGAGPGMECPPETDSGDVPL